MQTLKKPEYKKHVNVYCIDYSHRTVTSEARQRHTDSASRTQGCCAKFETLGAVMTNVKLAWRLEGAQEGTRVQHSLVPRYFELHCHGTASSQEPSHAQATVTETFPNT